MRGEGVRGGRALKIGHASPRSWRSGCSAPRHKCDGRGNRRGIDLRRSSRPLSPQRREGRGEGENDGALTIRKKLKRKWRNPEIGAIITLLRHQTIMNRTTLINTLAAFLLMLHAARLHAEIVTLTATATNGGTSLSSIITLASNDVAEVLHTKLESSNGGESVGVYSSALLVTVGGSTYRYTANSISNPAIGRPSIAGPATIQLSTTSAAGDNTDKALCTIKITRAADDIRPSTSVVIPADSSGPVSIILESSVDLITWTPALPGTYGGATQKRFFRVRAEKQP